MPGTAWSVSTTVVDDEEEKAKEEEEGERDGEYAGEAKSRLLDRTPKNSTDRRSQRVPGYLD